VGVSVHPRKAITARVSALNNDGHDDGTCFRHPPTQAPAECFLCRATCVSYVLKQHTTPGAEDRLVVQGVLHEAGRPPCHLGTRFDRWELCPRTSCGWRAAIALRSCSSIPRPYRERVGWKGKQRELMRGESQVRTSISGVSAGQRVRRFRAHNPKVAGSNPAPATKRTLGIPTFSRVFSRVRLSGNGVGLHLVRMRRGNRARAVAR
jgi:hypothetical protein